MLKKEVHGKSTSLPICPLVTCATESNKHLDFPVRQGGSVQNWNDIAMSLPGRTNKDCRKRWAKIQVDIRKGAWTQEEDERLQKAVLQLGCKWSQVGAMVQSRNADQCAKRWQHVLGPDVKHCSWTLEEDRKLLDAMSKFGNNWKQIGLTELPDRSTHDLRNRQVRNLKCHVHGPYS
ncbi:Homeodomain-like protein [Colletotrichum godetiae]|uniref:Homeodomain-like protein n=1 Tax=Colletotrichum godetiae TaxID=1209918 RepID=A0AAJ0A6V1_9PEZI|nr:Homeodomain-like protein [Colletotrichum godetiae]KAK1657134.1 Homeodomain-like protein [Colletotrichum godetiae]